MVTAPRLGVLFEDHW